ncbi:MAG: MFS transporter [Pirellulales bacterium]
MQIAALIVATAFKQCDPEQSDSHLLGKLAPVDASVSSAPRWLRVRLCAMMFLEYVPPALWAVTLGTYIIANTGSSGNQLFDSRFAGLAGISGALGAIAAPLLVGGIADRFLATQWVLAALHACCAVCLWFLSRGWSQPWFFAALIAYFQFFVPTFSLTNSLALRHLPRSREQFPAVRAWGTVGWVIAGLFIGFGWPAWFGESIEATTLPMLLAVVAHVVMALYCLTLPHTPPETIGRLGWQSLTQGGAWTLLRQPRVLMFLTISMLACVPVQFYYSFLNAYMNTMGIHGAAGIMSLGQVCEIACLISMPWMLRRVGIKHTFMLGLLAWVLRYALMAAGAITGSFVALVVAILLHGFCYVFVYVSGQLYLDYLAGPRSRSAAQGLSVLATSGLGHLTGAILAGSAQARYLTPPGVSPPPFDWLTFWLLPLAMFVGVLLLFLATFRVTEESTAPATLPVAPVIEPATG